MNPGTNPIIQKAERAVRQMVEQCRKDGPVYQSNPRAVAQVSRTGKWLLNAIAQLNQPLNTSKKEDPK